MNTRESLEQIGQYEVGWPIDQVVEIACHLADRDAIGVIHITTSQRLSYAELLCYRLRAAACGLTLSVTANSLILRPSRNAIEPIAEQSVWQKIRVMARRLRAQLERA